jgi:hypothetical protein
MVDSLTGFRPWRIILKFLAASSWAKPSPIPSEDPVISAHGGEAEEAVEDGEEVEGSEVEEEGCGCGHGGVEGLEGGG